MLWSYEVTDADAKMMLSVTHFTMAFMLQSTWRAWLLSSQVCTPSSPFHMYAHKHVHAGTVSTRALMKLVKCMQPPFLLELEMKQVHFAEQKWL